MGKEIKYICSNKDWNAQLLLEMCNKMQFIYLLYFVQCFFPTLIYLNVLRIPDLLNIRKTESCRDAKFKNLWRHFAVIGDGKVGITTYDFQW